MSDIKVERKESLSRQDAAARLSALADALANGGDVDLSQGGYSISMRVPDDVRTEFELEVDGDEIEIELELKWSTRTAPAPARRRRR